MAVIKQIGVLLLLTALAGCAMIDSKMASWVGHDQSDLIASWGPPQQIMDDGQGGKIYVYATTRSFTSPGSSTTTMSGNIELSGNPNYMSGTVTGTGYTTYVPPQTHSYNAYRMFWIDSSGRVYRWAWKGL